MTTKTVKAVLFLSCFSAVVLAACGAKGEREPVTSSLPSTSSSSSSQIEASSSSSAEATPSSSTSAEVTPPSSTSASSSFEQPAPVGLWSEEQAAQLQSYILDSWGPAMGQVYKPYTPASLGKFSGLPIPNGFLTATQDMIADLDGQTPELFWSTDGLAQPGQLAVVATYSDSEGSRSITQHLYVFTIDSQGVGQVWITKQNQGNPENKLYFRLTQNEALRDFFTQLVGH